MEYSNLEVAVAGVAPAGTTMEAFNRLGEIYITLPQTAETSVGIEPSAETPYPQRLSLRARRGARQTFLSRFARKSAAVWACEGVPEMEKRS